MLIEIEHFFDCPCCWERISMVLDLSAGKQRYIEDCEVCCRPIELIYDTDDDGLKNFNAAPIEQ